MAEAEQQQAAAASTQNAAAAVSLDDILNLTPEAQKTTVSTAVQDLVNSLVGQNKIAKSADVAIANRIAEIDAILSKQIAAIMHHPNFQKLEGTWRGLSHLVFNSETSTELKIRVMNVDKRTLFNDLDKAVEFDQSQMFKKLYEEEFGQAGGAPYGALVGDYEFTNHPEDIDLLTKMSGIAASAMCPFITSPAASLFGFKSWTELGKPRDLEKIFDSPEYIQWKSFRESEDSRWVVMAMPRVLSRLPYGKNTKTVEEFAFEEVELTAQGKGKVIPHDQYCWMNCAYVLATRMTDSFSKYGWCTSIRGFENGGKVEGLPTHIVEGEDGDLEQKVPTEVLITDRREAELSKVGFLSLGMYKNTDYAVFFGAQTAQKAKKYEGKGGNEATANAAIMARQPYNMAAGRIAHYLKVIARDKIGANMETNDVQDWLNTWISNYVLADPKAHADMKRRFPLAEAKIEVKAIPGKPGSYHAVAHIRPWLQLEELTTSLRMVAEIPKKG